jgi:hypothetical protein
LSSQPIWRAEIGAKTVSVWPFRERSKTFSGKEAVGHWRGERNDDDQATDQPPKRRGGGESGVREPRKPTPSSGGETSSR